MKARICGHGATAERLARLMDTPADTSVVCFSQRGGMILDPVAVHDAMMAGIRATATVLQGDSRQSLRSMVLVADGDGCGNASILASFLSCLGKTLARELARSRTTVNVVGGDFAGGADLPALIGFLLSDEARFITGQSFGTAGVRLANPRCAARTALADGWLLVSGGAGAIGSAVTRRLHADGWKILIGYRTGGEAGLLARDLSPDGTTCRVLTLDMEDEDAIRAVPDILHLGQALSGLILCSGWNMTHAFWTSGEAEWQRTLRVNFTGPALLAERLFGASTGNSGKVVTIGSEAGRAGDAGRAVYAGAKAAMTRYTSLLAEANGAVHAVTIAPGPVDTPLLRNTHGSHPEDVAKGLERLQRLIPLGRMGSREEIAAAISFATSPNGVAVNGELISVGGGITMQ